MSQKRILSILAVAIMVASCGVCLFADEGAAKVVNDAVPIYIDENGVINLDDETLNETYGATYSFDGEVATLVFTEDRDVTIGAADNHFIYSEVKMVMTIDCELKLTSKYSGGEITEDFIGIKSPDLTLNGNGKLDITIWDYTALNTQVIRISNECDISSCHISVKVKNINGLAIIKSGGDITIDHSWVEAKYEDDSGPSKYGNAGIKTNLSNKTITIKDSRIDFDFKSENAIDGIKADTIECENSQIKIVAAGGGNDSGLNGVSYGNTSKKITNCDIEITTPHSNDISIYCGFNGTLDISKSNLQLNGGNRIISVSDESYFRIDSAWTKYELRKTDGTTVSKNDFVNLTEGTIFNKDISIKFSLDGGEGTLPAAETGKEHGQSIVLPACNATKDGKIFVGWTDGFKTYKAGENYDASLDIELKAVYEKMSSNPDAGPAIIASVLTSLLLVMFASYIILIGRRRKDDD